MEGIRQIHPAVEGRDLAAVRVTTSPTLFVGQEETRLRDAYPGERSGVCPHFLGERTRHEHP
ncbi:MAG TPA: hypothetical protein DEP35_10815 [Deltaproteobacteria bacterium]|nr:hypothetical protein [Deltaproteobacteria bacterium]